MHERNGEHLNQIPSAVIRLHTSGTICLPSISTLEAVFRRLVSLDHEWLCQSNASKKADLKKMKEVDA